MSRRGDTIPVDESVAPIVDEKGEVLGRVTVLRDVTERRQAEKAIQELNAELEQRVAERTAQLEAANQELERFNDSIAHDLRAPLRGIDGFSTILIENHTANLGPQGLSYLNMIREGVERMRHLIEDMLSLSRVARQDYDPQKVNLSEFARDILAELQAQDRDRHVQSIVQDGVSVEGDGSLLRILLGNLLANAWKFTGKNPAPRIEFGSLAEEGKQICYVRDNGIGFDMKYAERMFGIFERLNTAEEFEGTGIGLARVERIIHRHGGRIWTNSAPGKGATFYFTV